jgi:hypothetical protein
VAPLPFRTQEREKEENNVRQLAQTSPKRNRKEREDCIRGQRHLQSRRLHRSCRPQIQRWISLLEGMWRLSANDTRTAVFEPYSGDTHPYPPPSALYQLALNDGRPSERLEGWQTIVESKEGPVTKYKHEQRIFLMRLTSEATESCTERSRGRGTYSQASSIIIITSNGGGYCRSMSRRFLHRQDLGYVQSITCSMYDIMTFLMARKKLSHFHSDLCYAMNAKHLPPTSAQGNAMQHQCSKLRSHRAVRRH